MFKPLHSAASNHNIGLEESSETIYLNSLVLCIAQPGPRKMKQLALGPAANGWPTERRKVMLLNLSQLQSASKESKCGKSAGTYGRHFVEENHMLLKHSKS